MPGYHYYFTIFNFTKFLRSVQVISIDAERKINREF